MFTGEMESTLLRSFIRASRLRQWIARPDCPPALDAVRIIFEKAFGTGPQPDDLAEEPGQLVKTPSDLRLLTGHSSLKLQARYRQDSVVFARASTHAGNSLIRFYCRGNAARPLNGSIKYIYWQDHTIRFAVNRQLPCPESVVDPFADFPELHATLHSADLSADLEEVKPSWVLGHCARWQLSTTLAVMLFLSRACTLILVAFLPVLITRSFL